MFIICDMQTIHGQSPPLSAIDMNLLVALDVLLDTRSVTAAARRLSVSQSAMSHQLSRLRALTGDPLLVRTREGMMPTPRAMALSLPVREGLERISSALSERPVWDPGTARRTFHIGTSDYAELVLLPPLMARLSRRAPGVDLFVRALDEDIAAQLSAGAIDIALAPEPQLRGQNGHTEHLADERFVCIMRKGHPLAKKKLTLDRFCAANHALIAPSGRPGGYVDDALRALGRSRRVALAVPHFLVAPHVVAESDLVLTLAERVARTFAEFLPLQIVAPPLELGGFTMLQAWHPRTHEDPGHRWLRAELATVARGGKTRGAPSR